MLLQFDAETTRQEENQMLHQDFGRLDPLYDAVRARAPEVDAARVRRAGVLEAQGDEPPVYMYVSYGTSGRRRVVWDAGVRTYMWNDGPDGGTALGHDADVAADRIAQALGAPISPVPTEE